MPFYIDADKNIEYGPQGIGSPFSSEAELAAIVAAQNLSKEGVTEVWNTFAGVVPFDDCKILKCFRNRPYGVAAIWKAIQRLVPEGEVATVMINPSVATDISDDTIDDAAATMAFVDSAPAIDDPEKMKTLRKRDGLRTKRKGLAKKVTDAVAKPAKAKKAGKPKAEGKEREPRDGTKKARLIEMMERKNGVSLDEVMEAFQWQKHTCRGAISTLGSKGLKIVAEKQDKRGMVYRVS